MKSGKSLRTAAGLALGMVFSLVLAPGQQQGGGQAPPSGGAGSRGPTAPPPSIPPTPTPGTREPTEPGRIGEPPSPFPEIRRPIFLSGKVVLEDGSPPPDPVTIERICNGVVRPEGYTDSKGRFSIELGRNTHMMADASVGSGADQGFGGMGTLGQQRGSPANLGNPMGGISERDLMGCELRASLPGFRSDVVMLTGRRLFDNPDVGQIVLRRLGNVEGTTISFSSLKAPKDAKKAYEKGRQALKKQKWANAQKEFEKAVQIYPEYATAWFELGRALEAQDNIQPARDAYAKALEADAKFVSPYLQLAGLAARDRNWQEVADTTDRVIKLNPFDFAGAYFYNSVANYNLRNFDAAERSARQALKLDTLHRYPKIDHILGVLLAQKNDLQGAAQHMRNYLELSPQAGDADLVKKQLGQIEALLGQSAQAQPQE